MPDAKISINIKKKIIAEGTKLKCGFSSKKMNILNTRLPAISTTMRVSKKLVIKSLIE